MNDVCSLELLTNAVANRLTADEETALYDHLERCEACCARMEQLAGGEQWQKEAASLLATDELDAAVPETTVWSEVDFSVEHLEPSEDANVLGQLGGYDVLAIIGRGGMGVVLKAFDRELKRFVAIKALSPHLAHSSVARKRFAREAQAAAAVVNPHVIAIHHVQPTGRLPFLIMPLLTGESLAQRLKSRAPLELTEVLRIGMQAAVGLAAAHDQGLVHRDVKPANIFLEKGVERVVITDFGLARAADDVSMTRLGVVAGTPEYMSPEQARGETLDGRSDLFSLGCVLYEMATGVSPFRSDSTIATLRRIVDDRPAAIASLAPELPPWFSYIVERLLSKDPAQRFASANEVALLLEQCLSHLQQPASVPLPASLVSHVKGSSSIFNSNKKGILTMLGTLGMALLGMVLWQATDPPDISGQWTSDEWGTVVLESKEKGVYEGTFTGPDVVQSSAVREAKSDNQSVFAPCDSKVIEVRVENGQAVKQGEILLVLRSDELEAELHAVEKAVREFEVKLNNFKTGYLSDDKELLRTFSVVAEAKEKRTLLQQKIEALQIRSSIDGVVANAKGKQHLLDRPVKRGDWLIGIWASASGAEFKGEFQQLSGFAFNDIDKTPVTLRLKWSRIERRFNGTWEKGDYRNGKMSLRLVVNEIRGAWTTNKGTQQESGSPRLADLTWKRSVVAVPDSVYGENKTYEDPKSGAQHSNKKLPKTVGQASVDDKAAELVETPQPPQQATVSDADANHSKDLNGFLIAWDFKYPLLGKRMAKLRVSRDMNLESVLPGRPSVKGQAPNEDVKELVELIAAQVKWEGDIGAEYESTVSSMAEFERVDTSVRTERVAINLEGKVRELQLDMSEHLEIVNRLWRLEGIVAIGGKEGLTELLAVAGQQLSIQFPEVRYKLSSGDFRFGIKDEMGTRIAYFRIPPDRNRQVMNFTLTLLPTGEPKFELDENSNDEPTKNVDTPPQPNGDARSTDSSKIYTVEEVIANGMELSSKQLPITVRVKVVSVRQEGTVNADGTKAQHWWLSSKEYNGGIDPSALKIRVSDNVEKALEGNGVTDIVAHFTGKELTITGKLSIGGVDLPGRDTILLFDISLDSLDQLILPVAETEHSNDEPTKNEDPPPQPIGFARSPDSSKIYTVEELIANGKELSNKQQPVTVRVKVVSVRREGTVNADGTKAQHWWLSSKAYNGGLDPSALKIRVSENVEKALARDGVTDLPAHFTGKELTITGKLSFSVARVLLHDDICLYRISLDSLDQLSSQSNR